MKNPGLPGRIQKMVCFARGAKPIAVLDFTPVLPGWRKASVVTIALVLVGVSGNADSSTIEVPPTVSPEEYLAQAAAKESEQDQLFLSRYRYHRVRIQEERESDGTSKKRTEKHADHIPSAKLLNSGGDPAPGPRPSSASSNVSPRGKAFQRKDLSLGKEVLSQFEFQTLDPEIHEGRLQKVFAFSPAKKQSRAVDFKQRLIQKAAGRIWVDDADQMISRADFRLTEPADIGGGLVAHLKKFEYQFQRSRTPDGLWYIQDLNWHLEGRQFLTQKIVEFSETKSNVLPQVLP